MKKAVLLLADGFEEVEAVTPIDFLRRAGIELHVLGVGGRRLTGGHGIQIAADASVDEFGKEFREDADAVLIPGGMPGAANVAASADARNLIMRAHADGKLIAAICAAPAVVLYPLGILDGKAATCYPGFEKEWTKARFSEERVVRDGAVITSRGPGTAAEFAEAVIEYLLDSDAAADIHRRTLQKA